MPAPRAGAVAEPMNMEVGGTVCDFCPTDPFADTDPEPVVWAFPAGEATRSAEQGSARGQEVPGSGEEVVDVLGEVPAIPEHAS